MKLLPTKPQIYLLSIGLFLTVFQLYPPSVHAEQQPISRQSKALDSIRTLRAEKVIAFKAAFPRVKVETNPVTGGPEDLWGDLSKNQTKTEPVEAAYEFFEQNKELYGMLSPRDELKLQYRTEKMVDFKQLYRGVEIYQSSIGAYFSPAGKLKGIKGSFLPIMDVSTTPLTDSIFAIDIARQDLRQSGKAVERMGGGSAHLIIYPSEDKYSLCWIVKMMDTLHIWESWQYNVDANSGAILGKGIRGIREPRITVPQKLPLPNEPSIENQQPKAIPELNQDTLSGQPDNSADLEKIVIPKEGVPIYRIENGKAIPISPEDTSEFFKSLNSLPAPER